jgi:hypothetical protein
MNWFIVTVVVYIDDMEEKDNTSGYQAEHYTPEARRSRFKRIAELRTNRILNDLRLLGNTGNKTLYQYDQADIDKIFDIINAKLTETRTRFKTSKKEKPFSLDED